MGPKYKETQNSEMPIIITKYEDSSVNMESLYSDRQSEDLESISFSKDSQNREILIEEIRVED